MIADTRRAGARKMPSTCIYRRMPGQPKRLYISAPNAGERSRRAAARTDDTTKIEMRAALYAPHGRRCHDIRGRQKPASQRRATHADDVLRLSTISGVHRAGHRHSALDADTKKFSGARRCPAPFTPSMPPANAPRAAPHEKLRCRARVLSTPPRLDAQKFARIAALQPP